MPGLVGSAGTTNTSGNDVINAVIDGTTTTNQTLTGLDVINGGAGTDTLNIRNISAANKDKTDLSVATISNVETINIQSAADISNADGSNTAVTNNVDFSGISGLTTLNATKSAAVLLKAAATTDVNVSGASGFISVLGGKDVSVTDATAATKIEVGDATATTGSPAGKITVTDSNNGSATASDNDITVTGGTDVTVTTTADKADSGAITVGDATNGMASGAVVVTQNSTSNGTAMVAGNVTVTGGSTVNITANMTNTATAGNGGNITAGTYAVVGGNTTTAVTITQNATATDLAATTVAATAETAVVTFGALAAGESVSISYGVQNVTGTASNDLTFTASKALTAAEVAAAFANLTAADIQASGGKTANGYFTGALDSGWTSGAATGAKVTFTATTAGVMASDITVNTDATNDWSSADNAAANADFGVVVTQGAAASTTVAAQDVTADFGAVTVDDNATKSITTITLNGYDTATLGAGAGGSLDSLTTLNLSNSAGANALTSTSKTLTATLNAITGTTDLGGSVETLTINTTGTASSTALTAGALKSLTVNAGANLTVTPTSIAALETLTVTGSGNVTMGDISAATTTITAGSATGAISATVDGTKATVTTGSGADSITLNTTSVTKAVNLGAGNDTLTLASGTTSLTSEMVAGDGTDTLVMTGADAETASAATTFETKITGFEKLQVKEIVAGQTDTVNLANMDDINYVISAGSTASTNVREVQSFSVTNGVTATKTNQTQTIDFSGVLVGAAGAGTMTVGGVSVALANGDTAITIAAKVAQELNGKTAGTTENVAAAAAGNIVTITFDTRDTNFAALALAIGTVTLDGNSSALPANATAGTAYAANNVSITVGGVGVTLLAQDKTAAGTVVAGSGDDTATEVATKIVTALDANATYNAAGTSNTGAAVTVTFDAFGDQSAITSTLAGGVTLGTVTETTKGAAATGDLTLTNMANNGTLELTAAAGTTTVTMTDATGTADTFNIVTKVNASDLDFGTVAVAGVETVNITATDTTPVNTTTGAATISKATMTLSDAAVKSVVITGESDLALTAAGSSLTTVNASAFTGKLTFSSAVNSATVTGGTAADTLTATGTSQTLNGGAGADTLTGANLTTLTGGAGNDTFVMNKPTNVNSYSTITDLSSGDVIDFGSVTTIVFKSAGVTLASTAVFQDYANAAVNSLSTDGDDVAWFNFDGNTYIIQSGNTTANNDFVNGSDSIIKIAGVVDLSTASYNQTTATLEIA